MTEVINLNQSRKVKARAEKEKKASQNRAKFGQTKEQKQIEKLNADRADRHLKGHKLENAEE